MPAWLPDETLQAITIEHNQSETAFFVPMEDGFELRWFTTSKGEIDLCGHATLASAHVIYRHLLYPNSVIRFATRQSGMLTVHRQGDIMTLNLPAWLPERLAGPPAGTVEGLGGVTPLETWMKRDYLFVLPDESTVRDLAPDFGLLGRLDKRVCVTAPGIECDFVSRFFCPGDALEEDPVTGSAHCMLIPYWASRLNKMELSARQFRRGGSLICELSGDRVMIGGQARTYMQGTIFLP